MPAISHNFIVVIFFFCFEVDFAIGCFELFFLFLLDSGCTRGGFAGFTRSGRFEHDFEFFAAAHAEAEFLD